MIDDVGDEPKEDVQSEKDDAPAGIEVPNERNSQHTSRHAEGEKCAAIGLVAQTNHTIR